MTIFFEKQLTRNQILGVLLALPFTLALPISVSAEKWKDRDCRKDVGEGGIAVEVCRDGDSIGFFWDDGSFVNGWCNDSGAYKIKYKGLSKKDAVLWIKSYCD